MSMSAEYVEMLAEHDEIQRMMDSMDYEEGMRAGERDGRDAWHAFTEPVRTHEPDRTPWLDGYDDGFTAGWHLERTRQ